MPFMSHKERESLAIALFHGAGGYKRELRILTRDDEKFHDWSKELLIKRLPKPVELSMGDSVEALYDKLDKIEREKNMRTINAEVVEVCDAAQKLTE